MRDITIRIGDDGAIVNAVEDQLIHFELPVYFLCRLIGFFPRHLVSSFLYPLECINPATHILFDI
jgi:hypothetical protein